MRLHFLVPLPVPWESLLGNCQARKPDEQFGKSFFAKKTGSILHHQDPQQDFQRRPSDSANSKGRGLKVTWAKWFCESLIFKIP